MELLSSCFILLMVVGGVSQELERERQAGEAGAGVGGADRAPEERQRPGQGLGRERQRRPGAPGGLAGRRRGQRQRGKFEDHMGPGRGPGGLRPGGPGKPKTGRRYILDHLFHNYHREEPPTEDRPTQVKIGIYVNSFYSISEQTMDYRLIMYLRQKWRDPRLQFEPIEGITEIKLEDGTWDKIWTPDTFFRNEKGAEFHRVTKPNRMLKLKANGELWYVTKISATLSCPMKLQKYPLDTQKCPMMFESFGYTMDTLYFGWLDDPVQIDKFVELAQFTLVEKILYDCSQNYTAGAFPCLEIRFLLRRDIGFFLIQVYIPSILIVILSWVAFWINIDAIPARVSLGLLTVLAMTTQSTGARSSLPRVSYIKAMDVWMSMCLVFVFASLLEFAVVNVISRKEVRTIKPDEEEELNCVQKCCHKTGIDGCDSLAKGPKVFYLQGKPKAQEIENISRYAFPLSFLIFNAVYWIYYTLPEPLSVGPS